MSRIGLGPRRLEQPTSDPSFDAFPACECCGIEAGACECPECAKCGQGDPACYAAGHIPWPAATSNKARHYRMLETCWRRGWLASRDGMAAHTNPYRSEYRPSGVNALRTTAWLEGYRAHETGKPLLAPHGGGGYA